MRAIITGKRGLLRFAPLECDARERPCQGFARHTLIISVHARSLCDRRSFIEDVCYFFLRKTARIELWVGDENSEVGVGTGCENSKDCMMRSEVV